MVVYNFANKVGGGGAKPSYQLNMTTKLMEGSPKQVNKPIVCAMELFCDVKFKKH